MALLYGVSLKYSFLTILMKSIVCLSLTPVQFENIPQPEVQISQGALRGYTLTTQHGRNVSGFLGIPFAQPPVGNLRFANPLPADNWNGTRDATVDGKLCPQSFGSGVMMGDEDCLYLNVYTPQLPESSNSSLLPVMVHLHGGAYISGSASPDALGPEFLLDADVLLVLPNYRLGPLGFLTTGDEVASGNWALKDLVLALQWVQANIAKFGGDPEQVTIFGISAGSNAVHMLTLSNATHGLFHKYITQSGSAIATWAWEPRSFAAKKAFQLGEYVNCFENTTDSLIDCLRLANASDILATLPNFLTGDLNYINWIPTDEPDIEGAVLTDSPANIYANGGVRDLPWISGVTHDEGLLHTARYYVDDESFWKFMDNFRTYLPKIMSWEYQPDGGAAWANATLSHYFNDDLTGNKSQLLTNLTALVSDGLFFHPAYKGLTASGWLLNANSSGYLYLFNYRGAVSGTFYPTGSTEDFGVAHGDDTNYLFRDNRGPGDFNQSLTESDYAMVDSMVELWTSFAINGTPTASSLNNVEWKPFSNDESFLEIGNHTDVVFQLRHTFFKERMQFWEELTSGTPNKNAAGSIYNRNFLAILVTFLTILTMRSTII